MISTNSTDSRNHQKLVSFAIFSGQIQLIMMTESVKALFDRMRLEAAPTSSGKHFSDIILYNPCNLALMQLINSWRIMACCP